jgi:hypothetical protein
MQVYVINLAEKILAPVENENPYDAVSTLKAAMILIPSRTIPCQGTPVC